MSGMKTAGSANQLRQRIVMLPNLHSDCQFLRREFQGRCALFEDFGISAGRDPSGDCLLANFVWDGLLDLVGDIWLGLNGHVQADKVLPFRSVKMPAWGKLTVRPAPRPFALPFCCPMLAPLDDDGEVSLNTLRIGLLPLIKFRQ